MLAAGNQEASHIGRRSRSAKRTKTYRSEGGSLKRLVDDHRSGGDPPHPTRRPDRGQNPCKRCLTSCFKKNMMLEAPSTPSQGEMGFHPHRHHGERMADVEARQGPKPVQEMPDVAFRKDMTPMAPSTPSQGGIGFHPYRRRGEKTADTTSPTTMALLVGPRVVASNNAGMRPSTPMLKIGRAHV